MEITPEARDYLIELSARDDGRVSRPTVGFSPAGGGDGTAPREMGARPLARVLDRTVERRIAAAINDGRVKPGDHLVIRADASDPSGLEITCR